MSILIRGIEMPKSCWDCPFMVSRDNDDCILQSDEANEGFEDWEQMKDSCPLVPVPPHGRLIDADALFPLYADLLDGGDVQPVIPKIVIDTAPTIIEAEEGDE